MIEINKGRENMPDRRFIQRTKKSYSDILFLIAHKGIKDSSHEKTF